MKVDYEVLPAVFDPELAMRDGAPVVHDKPANDAMFDPKHNLVAKVEGGIGDVEAGFALADTHPRRHLLCAARAARASRNARRHRLDRC